MSRLQEYRDALFHDDGTPSHQQAFGAGHTSHTDDGGAGEDRTARTDGELYVKYHGGLMGMQNLIAALGSPQAAQVLISRNPTPQEYAQIQSLRQQFGEHNLPPAPQPLPGAESRPPAEPTGQAYNDQTGRVHRVVFDAQGNVKSWGAPLDKPSEGPAAKDYPPAGFITHDASGFAWIADGRGGETRSTDPRHDKQQAAPNVPRPDTITVNGPSGFGSYILNPDGTLGTFIGNTQAPKDPATAGAPQLLDIGGISYGWNPATGRYDLDVGDVANAPPAYKPPISKGSLDNLDEQGLAAALKRAQQVGAKVTKSGEGWVIEDRETGEVVRFEPEYTFDSSVPNRLTGNLKYRAFSEYAGQPPVSTPARLAPPSAPMGGGVQLGSPQQVRASASVNGGSAASPPAAAPPRAPAPNYPTPYTSSPPPPSTNGLPQGGAGYVYAPEYGGYMTQEMYDSIPANWNKPPIMQFKKGGTVQAGVKRDSSGRSEGRDQATSSRKAAKQKQADKTERKATREEGYERIDRESARTSAYNAGESNWQQATKASTGYSVPKIEVRQPPRGGVQLGFNPATGRFDTPQDGAAMPSAGDSYGWNPATGRFDMQQAASPASAAPPMGDPGFYVTPESLGGSSQVDPGFMVSPESLGGSAAVDPGFYKDPSDPIWGGGRFGAPFITPPNTGPMDMGPEGRTFAQITGTQYVSDNERAWYLGQLGKTPATVPQGAGVQLGPDGRSAAQIQGTPYRSEAERAFYLANQPQARTQALGVPAGHQTVNTSVASRGTGAGYGGTVYTLDDVRTIGHAAQSAGFRGEALVKAIAVAMAESGGHGFNAHNQVGEDSRGPWQINVGPGANTQLAGMNLKDPYEAAKAAFIVSNGGSNFNPWTVTHAKNGTPVNKYMDAARQVVNQMGVPGYAGGTGKAGLVLDEPAYIVGLRTGQIHGIAGEPTEDEPMGQQERITPTANGWKIDPLHRPQTGGYQPFATGGNIISVTKNGVTYTGPASGQAKAAPSSAPRATTQGTISYRWPDGSKHPTPYKSGPLEKYRPQTYAPQQNYMDLQAADLAAQKAETARQVAAQLAIFRQQNTNYGAEKAEMARQNAAAGAYLGLQRQDVQATQQEYAAMQAAQNNVVNIEAVARMRRDQQNYDPRYREAGMQAPNDVLRPLSGAGVQLAPGSRYALETQAGFLGRKQEVAQNQRGLGLNLSRQNVSEAEFAGGAPASRALDLKGAGVRLNEAEFAGGAPASRRLGLNEAGLGVDRAQFSQTEQNRWAEVLYDEVTALAYEDKGSAINRGKTVNTYALEQAIRAEDWSSVAKLLGISKSKVDSVVKGKFANGGEIKVPEGRGVVLAAA